MKMKKRVCNSCSEEFNLSNCGFTHLPPDEFVKSQWQTKTKSTLFFMYRWFIAIFFILVVIHSLPKNVTALDWGLYFIYLTHWGILMCMITTTTGAILVTIWHYHPEYADRINEKNEMPSAFKVYWAMHNTTLILSFVITIIYWGILYNDKTVIDANNVLIHITNAVIMFLDVIIVAYPIRLMHIIQPVAMGIFYCLFSVVFYLCGGTDKNGNRWIYSVLDWSKPDTTMITAVGTFVLAIFVHIFLFLVYKIRSVIHAKWFKDVFILPTNTTLQTVSTVSCGTDCVNNRPTGISMVLGNYGHDNHAFTQSSEKMH